MEARSDTRDAGSGTAFAGFPARPQATAIPNVFFSDVLPRIADDAFLLTVTLCAFQALANKRGFPRYITTEEIVGHPAVKAFFKSKPVPQREGRERTTDALTRAAELKVLVALTVRSADDERALYFLNAPADRRGLEAVRSGAVDVGRPVTVAPTPDPERSSIFALYESLIGTISPLVADELAEAERLYPAAWLEAAFREAAAQNARSWRYVSRILERWAAEGPDYATTERDPAGEDRYFRGKYGQALRRRIDP